MSQDIAILNNLLKSYPKPPDLTYKVRQYLWDLDLHEVCIAHGHPFNKPEIQEWIKKNGTCPIDSTPLTEREVKPCSDAALLGLAVIQAQSRFFITD